MKKTISGTLYLLPTDKESRLYFDGNKLRLGLPLVPKVDSKCTNWCLYLTLPQFNPLGVIKEWDWCIENGKCLYQATKTQHRILLVLSGHEKIISTNDTSLLPISKTAYGEKYGYPLYYFLESFYPTFLSKYNSGREWNKIEVELEERWKDLGDRGDGLHIYETNHWQIKTISNGIILSYVDKAQRSYTREEVVNLLHKYRTETPNAKRKKFADNWIKENLK